MAPKMQYLLLVAMVALGCGGAAGDRVPAIYAFGDSLADVGNNNYLPVGVKVNFPHYGIDFKGGVATGRFSNGYNGIDYLAKMVGFPESPPAFLSLKNGIKLILGAKFTGVNFASGGSEILNATGGTISLTAQVENYKLVLLALNKQIGPKVLSHLLPDSLFIFSIGNNDLFGYYARPGPKNITTNQQFIDSLIEKWSSKLVMLHQLGMRKFVMLGLGHLGCIPYLRNINPHGECIEELNQLARQFNTAIEARLKLLSSSLKGFKYTYTNSYYLSSLVKAFPHRFGFTELEVACCGSGRYNGATQCTPNTTYCPNRENHIFWDWFHPTQAMYKLAMTKAYNGSVKFATPINIQQLIAEH